MPVGLKWMRKARLALAAVAAASALTVVAPPAQAGTCQVNNPDVDELVCDTVYEPTMRIVCGVVTKIFGQCLA